VTADALHCQRDHVAYLASRGAHWILTVKDNQPSLRQQLAGLPWRLVPSTDRDTTRGHGRREIRTLKILSISTGIDFPNAAQAIQIWRRRRRLDQPTRFTTETVYAITDLLVHQAKPMQLADWIRGHWSIENKIHWVRDCHLRRRPLPNPHRHRSASHGHAPRRRHQRPAPGWRHQHRRSKRHCARDANRPLALLGIT
jgi:predicted transposase YbfD/YdcC